MVDVAAGLSGESWMCFSISAILLMASIAVLREGVEVKKHRVIGLLTNCVIIVSSQWGNGAQAQVDARPWMNPKIAPDVRAEMVLHEMTLDEKITLLHGTGQPGFGTPGPKAVLSNGGAGYVDGIPRLGIPGIQMADAAYGVTKSERAGRYATALPSNMALAATWDLESATDFGTLIGRELRAQGYNMTLGGGTNLARELRNGRNFEYQGEDPLLAGTMVGRTMKALQAQHVIGDIKHFAMNDQESGRNAVNVQIDERSMRETDLLAFQIGLRDSGAGAVMCSYNRVNGDFACENKYLLTDVLRKSFGFQGFVVSDWGGTHSTIKASAAGLDNEEPGEFFYGEPLRHAVLDGTISQKELDEHVKRVLFAEFSAGLFEHPQQRSVVDAERGLQVSQAIAERSMVLLKNQNNILPLDSKALRHVAIIGSHANIAMLSGGGSAQVDPPVGNAIAPPGQGQEKWMSEVWFPASPLHELRVRCPNVAFNFASGDDLQEAAKLAKNSDAVIVFANQWESEAMDLPTLGLSGRQDELIAEVAHANPNTVVVVESGSAVLMPWAGSVKAILETWYSGSRGAAALARVLLGDVNPSGRLPITFPLADRDLPQASIVQPPKASQGQFYGNYEDEQNRKGFPPFDVKYDEGLNVGYKWYAFKGKQVLFPFGFGLSYTTFSYSDLVMSIHGDRVSATMTVRNTGNLSGATVAEIYASLPASAAEPQRLVAWKRVELAAGQSQQVHLDLDPLALSVFDSASERFHRAEGSYEFRGGASSADLPAKTVLNIR
ncbi:glycoside hydrolase family 3 C-terminal domain-containing protein [Granulicella mallensis]|uniref:Beta-glucosidase n=1 Tax=Granulicella mallensis TaxID=940614 RepID=A0A7W8E7P2_9BACT|nr:glycoside hydrolase family 3 C-terminal domain-containing protein [Granulicella mallensis]MBB5061937.1 beta-glucosidase [Granulicella mallensis]